MCGSSEKDASQTLRLDQGSAGAIVTDVCARLTHLCPFVLCNDGHLREKLFFFFLLGMEVILENVLQPALAGSCLCQPEGAGHGDGRGVMGAGLQVTGDRQPTQRSAFTSPPTPSQCLQ